MNDHDSSPTPPDDVPPRADDPSAAADAAPTGTDTDATGGSAAGSAGAGDDRTQRPEWYRRWLPGVLVGLATLLAVVSAVTTWVRSEALDTEVWVDTSSELLAEPEVQDALTSYLSEQLFTRVDLTETLESVLPDALDGLAGPIAGTLEGAAETRIDQVVASPQFALLWQEGNRVTHRVLVAILRDDTSELVSTGDGAVTLDLSVALQRVGTAVGLPESVLDRIPEDAGQIVVFQADELASAQDAVRILDFLSWFLFLVVVVLYAVAVYLAVGRRPRMLGLVGLALVGAGLGLLILRSIGIRTGVSLLVEDPAIEPVATTVSLVSTELLREMSWAAAIYGVLIMLFAALLGDHRWAVATRRSIRPWASATGFLVGGTAVLILLLVWWNPGRAFDRWATGLVLVALVVGAVVVLTSVVRREAAEQIPSDATPS